jgi:hypothetical protein
MTIDLERLAVDLDYWDEVAPEGATHFMYSEKFVKWVDVVEWEFYAFSDRVWKEAFCDWSLQDYINRGDGCVTAKPAAQEWDGKGLPPVGCECEVIFLCETWERAKIVAHVRTVHGTKAVWQLIVFDEWGADTDESFRPIRSQAEREREPVIIAALRAADPPADDEIHPRQYLIDSLNILYDAGMLRMPDEDVAKKARGEL